MNAKTDSDFSSLLQSHFAALTETIEALTASGRKDEANLKKAARNIYGLFLSLLKKDADEDGIHHLFATLPHTWRAARSLAIEYNDFVRTTIEDTKLDALSDIQRLYAQCNEEVTGNA